MDLALNNLRRLICHKTKPSSFAGISSWSMKAVKESYGKKTRKNIILKFQLYYIWDFFLRIL